MVRGDVPIPVSAWRRRRPADLLKLLSLAPGHVLARDQVIEALWPDKDPSSGANNLHRALYDLRQVLGGRWVNVDRGFIAMRPDAWVDVDAFEAAVATGRVEGFAAAIALYRGDLSPEDQDSPWLVPRCSGRVTVSSGCSTALGMNSVCPEAETASGVNREASRRRAPPARRALRFGENTTEAPS